jgi:hypothetical protein
MEFPPFATRPNYREIVFRSSTDIGKDLFDRQIERALADIDTLVSTHAERMTDIALEVAGYLLHCVRGFDPYRRNGGLGVCTDSYADSLSVGNWGIGN